MITDITIGQYFPGKSFIHKLDARTKILLTLVFLVFIFVCKNFYSLLLVCGFGVVAYLTSRISPKVILKSFKPLIPIVLLTTILQLYYIKDGNLLFEWKFISITDKGVFTAIFIAARILTLLLVSMFSIAVIFIPPHYFLFLIFQLLLLMLHLQQEDNYFYP